MAGSNFAAALVPDPALVIDAKYRMNNADRAYIDSQILALQLILSQGFKQLGLLPPIAASGPTAWGDPANPTISQSAAGITVDATANITILAYAASNFPDNTAIDFNFTLVGRDMAQNGDSYRADLFVTYQRFGGAAPSLVGGAATPQNVRTNGAGNTWGTPQLAVSAGAILAQVTGKAGRNIHWQYICQAQNLRG